jgi:tRNA modification GTPase
MIPLPGLASALPVEIYFWKAPHTYTGQELVELHTVSSPPLVDLLIGQLLNAGCRAAQPGEFTLRAFLAGKVDLPRAEAVLGVIEASDRGELKQALAQLAGGMAGPLQVLREDLLSLLADVEAGLDFSEEAIQFVQQKELLDRLTRGLAHLTLLQKQLNRRSQSERPFRVVLAGPPNAGKSSLFNAITRESAALVSPIPGTTRDYLLRRLRLGEVTLDLIDTAGRHDAHDDIGVKAQELGTEQVDGADLILWCLEAGQLGGQQQDIPSRYGNKRVLTVVTKSDLARSSLPIPQTSSVTGEGIETLRTLLADRVRTSRASGLAPSLSRCRHHVDSCLQYLRAAHSSVLFNEPGEILALELRGALDQIGEMVGAIYTDDLLDRIFSRFCIGK